MLLHLSIDNGKHWVASLYCILLLYYIKREICNGKYKVYTAHTQIHTHTCTNTHTHTHTHTNIHSHIFINIQWNILMYICRYMGGSPFGVVDGVINCDISGTNRLNIITIVLLRGLALNGPRRLICHLKRIYVCVCARARTRKLISPICSAFSLFTGLQWYTCAHF